MVIPPLRGRGLGNIGYMLLFDAVTLWALFSWQYLDTLLSGERHSVAPMVNGALVIIAALIALGASMFLPQRWKDLIVFWRTGNSFSSCKAFSELARNDYRYSAEELEQRIGPFPTAPVEQQTRWEELYAKHEGLAMVVYMRRQYLLCYEIAVISLLLMVAMLVPAAIRWSSQDFVLLGPLSLIGQYIAFMIAARIMGDNLVQGVLAIEAASG